MEQQKLLLSETVIEGLRQLSTVEQSKELIENVALKLLEKTDIDADINSQQYEYAIVTVFTEATKHCCDAYNLRKQLGEHNLKQNVSEDLVRVYTQYRKDFIIRQMQINASFPQVTDVQWRIVKDIKSAVTDQDEEEMNFEITLGHHSEDGEFKNVVQFFANTEELQSMISKLKDIERHCEKFANE